MRVGYDTMCFGQNEEEGGERDPRRKETETMRACDRHRKTKRKEGRKEGNKEGNKEGGKEGGMAKKKCSYQRSRISNVFLS